MSALIEKIVGDLGDKARWRRYRARVAALPAGHRDAVEALERYLARVGAISTGSVLVDLHEELAGRFERAAAAGAPVRDVVGDDPVRFADALLARHPGGGWADGERRRLVAALARAARRDGSAGA
ncbi:DUF1048 domain-containing protein [Kineococcus sp. SYSU DK004]|uniref:DUF1048 domain-containing protein n=1 Tax=Kineococcus sp. SYSU DK004 TaxID=3383125 RepID=UPI003D7E59AD